MAIGPDRVQPAKYESTALGGDDADEGPVGGPMPVSAQEDALECAGVYFQDASNRDEQVYLFRDLGKLMVGDTVTTATAPVSVQAHLYEDDGSLVFDEDSDATEGDLLYDE